MRSTTTTTTAAAAAADPRPATPPSPNHDTTTTTTEPTHGTTHDSTTRRSPLLQIETDVVGLFALSRGWFHTMEHGWNKAHKPRRPIEVRVRIHLKIWITGRGGSCS